MTCELNTKTFVNINESKHTIFILPHLSSGLHLCCNHALFKLCIAIKHLCEIPYCYNCKDGLFIYITGLRMK